MRGFGPGHPLHGLGSESLECQFEHHLDSLVVRFVFEPEVACVFDDVIEHFCIRILSKALMLTQCSFELCMSFQTVTNAGEAFGPEVEVQEDVPHALDVVSS